MTRTGTADAAVPLTERLVHVADFAVAPPTVRLVTTGIGSCVAIALQCPRTGVGALAHVLLPHPVATTVDFTPGRFAATAVPAMVKRMRELGAGPDLEARMVGGASMFAALLAPGTISLGARNVAAAHVACSAQRIRVVNSDVGGAHGRSVYFDLAQRSLLVRSIQMGDVTL